MTTRQVPARTTDPRGEALVWIDHDQAVIVGRSPDGDHVALLNRRPAESRASLDARTVDGVTDRERVVVSGPGYARIDFERAYVAATHRPDRLVDVEPNRPALRQAS